MRKLFICYSLLCAMVFFGCTGDELPVEAVAQQDKVEVGAMMRDCSAVKETAEDYAERYGTYPDEIDIDREIVIQTAVVVDFENGVFPDGPVDEWVEIPRGTVKIDPGTISYTVIRWEGWNLGYIVVGHGVDGPIVELTSGDFHEETIVRVNCLQLQAAVEEFAMRSGGEYPADVDDDRTPCGYTVVNLLPRGHLCRNPYTGEVTVPVDRAPVTPGEIGYSAINEFYSYKGMKRTGYVISGHGEEEIVCIINNSAYSSMGALVIQNCLTIEQAVVQYSLNNNGIYPGSLCDSDISGRTVIDYLPGGRFLTNPCTGMKTEPIDAVSCNPGESGYVAVYCGGSMGYCGYCITGADRTMEIVCTLWHGPPEDDEH